MIIAILRTSYRKVVFLLDCDRILQEFLKDRREDRDHHAGENDDQADQYQAGCIIKITHHENERHEQYEQAADRSRAQFDILQHMHRQIGKCQILIDETQQPEDLVQSEEIDARRCIQADHEGILQIGKAWDQFDQEGRNFRDDKNAERQYRQSQQEDYRFQKECFSFHLHNTSFGFVTVILAFYLSIINNYLSF
jgi:hypothetical protein